MLMGFAQDDPVAQSMVAAFREQRMGAIHGRGYYDRIGLGEACFSGARVDAEGATVVRKQLRRGQVREPNQTNEPFRGQRRPTSRKGQRIAKMTNAYLSAVATRYKPAW
jgi:hypothetical protein